MFDALNHYDNNYPMDKGNTTDIFYKFDQIRQYGFTMGNGNGGPNANKVKLQEFETELLSYYPLSDTVLNGLIDLYDELQPTPSFPPPFMRTVLEAKASFSYEVRENIEQCNLPLGIKNQILEKDDNTVLVPNYAYDDFLNSFTEYQSLYKVLETQQKNQLESGMDPADPLFDNDFVTDEQLRLILNTNREVYIKNNLIKLYDSCRYAIFQGSITEVYADLGKLDGNGFVATPTGINEPITGLAVSTMNTYFPMNYASANPEYIELEHDREGAVLNLSSIDSYLSFCPQSTYDFTYNENNPLEVMFSSTTTSNSAAIGTIYQYWTFGDGTGSFQTNPVHSYSQPGFYEVTLTTFNNQCGCWDVINLNIVVGSLDKACNVMSNDQYTSITSTTTLSFNLGITNLSSSVLESADFYFGDGNSTSVLGLVPHQNSNLYFFNHTYNPSPNQTVTYFPYLEYTLLNGCTNKIYFQKIIFPKVVTDCCDDGDKEKEQVPFFDGIYKIKIKNKVQGKIKFMSSPKIKAEHTFYKKRSGAGYKKEKCSNFINFSGSINIKKNDGCEPSRNINFNTNSSMILYSNYGKSIDVKVTYAEAFGLTTPNQIIIEHRIIYGNIDRSFFYYYGSCN